MKFKEEAFIRQLIIKNAYDEEVAIKQELQNKNVAISHMPLLFFFKKMQKKPKPSQLRYRSRIRKKRRQTLLKMFLELEEQNKEKEQKIAEEELASQASLKEVHKKVMKERELKIYLTHRAKI